MEHKNELQLGSSVSYQVGEVQFYNYDEILQQAHQVAELVKSVEVDESSIQGTKKLLASVNKKVKELEDERIRIKKELLVPYMEFEKQIKSITSVVKESDNELRSKVRELEEIERQNKRQVIESLFEKRIKVYPTLFFLTSDLFIKSQHLNKTSSLNKIELELVNWFEEKKKEVEYLQSIEGSNFEYYTQTLDLLASLPKPEQTVDTPKIEYATIQVDKNRLAELNLFMKLNQIEFKLGETK